MTNETIFMNRELSWLKFNERVLEEAESEKNPLCERLTFASIYQSNLDEFFMVRVGSLIDQMIVSKNVKDNKTGMTAKEQIQAILARVAKLNRRKDTVYENLMDEVAQAGIRLVDFRKIGKKEGKYLEQYFDAEIAPLISPIVVGKRQPFPFLKNKGIYAVVVLEKKNGKEKLGIIPCNSGVFPRLVQVPGEEETYMLAEELILHFISKVFKGYFVKAKSLIRVTRNADIDADALYDEDLDYRDFMEEIIKKRKRLLPVRVEFSRENWMEISWIRSASIWIWMANMYSVEVHHLICPLYSRSRTACAIIRNCSMRNECLRSLHRLTAKDRFWSRSRRKINYCLIHMRVYVRF